MAPCHHLKNTTLTVWDGLINQHMPLTQIKVRQRPCPWVSHGDGDLRQLMTDRDNARTEKDRNPCPATWEAYRGQNPTFQINSYNLCQFNLPTSCRLTVSALLAEHACQCILYT